MNENLPKELMKLINGFGVLAETTMLAYKSFLNAGFSEEDSLYLASEVMVTALKASQGRDNK